MSAGNRFGGNTWVSVWVTSAAKMDPESTAQQRGPYLVISTAVSWLAMPFSGMAFPLPFRFTMDFCHLQKLSRDFPAWWLISRVGWNRSKRRS